MVSKALEKLSNDLRLLSKRVLEAEEIEACSSSMVCAHKRSRTTMPRGGQTTRVRRWTHEEPRRSRHRRCREACHIAARRVGSNRGLHGRLGGKELVAPNRLERGALVGERGRAALSSGDVGTCARDSTLASGFLEHTRLLKNSLYARLVPRSGATRNVMLESRCPSGCAF